MKTCPHCGASLSENASFCPHCTKSLVEKTALKPYRTLPIRKVFLVLIPLLILGILLILPWKKALSPAPSENTELPATLTDTNTEITDSAAPLPSTEAEPADTDEQTDGAASAGEESTVTEDSAPTTDTETPTDSETATEQTDSATEDTQIIYTPETAPLSGTYVYKGVEWYYETPTSKQSRYPSYETHEMAYITGMNNLAEDGIYYVPETVHGKHVILIQQPETVQARYSFNSKEFRDSLKVITFPPEAYGTTTFFLSDPNGLTDIYVASNKFYLRLVEFTGQSLTVHSTKNCINTADPEKDLSMQEYCAELSDENRRIQWEEWDPATLYPNS